VKDIKKRYFVIIVAIAFTMLVGSVVAFPVILPQNKKYEAILGGVQKVTGSIILSTEFGGFVIMPIPSDGTGVGSSPENPVYFGSDLPIGFGVWDEGDWVFDVRLNATASTPTDSIFEVQFKGMTLFSAETLYVATGSTVDEGAVIILVFGIGDTLPTNIPWRVTVEKIA
jgi:hypothetical protein